MFFSKPVIYSAAIVTLFSVVDAVAQQISITSPTSTVSVAEGDDYASDELQNPWDFNERRDIGWEENFVGTSISAQNGVWSGANSSIGSYVFPLFGGYKDSLFAEGLPGDRQLPRFGINHPIDTNRHYLLSFKAKKSSPSTFGVYWNNNPSVSYWPDGSNFGASIDGFYQGNFFPNSDWSITSVNLKNLSSSFEQYRGSWSGSVIALRIDPSIAAPSGATTAFDWIRLVDPNSAPNVTISWSSRGVSANRLTTIWLDDDNQGYNGTPLKRFSNGSDPGSFTFPSAILPPGRYYFYVTSEVGANLSREAISGYSAPLVINQSPEVFFSSPSEISGADFATSEVSNPWDMDDAADIPNLNRSAWSNVWRQFTSESFQGGIFQAVSSPPLTSIGNSEGDAQVHLNIPSGRTVNTNRYRYLTYRIAADETLHTSIDSKTSDGWFARPIFWNVDVVADGGRPKAHILYEGWKTYVIDLWGNNAGTGLIEQGTPWRNFGSLSHLRIDPLETKTPTWFFVDDAKLTTENYASGGSFVARFNVLDQDSSNLRVALYYDTDASGFNGNYLGELTAGGSGYYEFAFDTNSIPLPRGTSIYLYAEVNDGFSVRRRYTSVPIILGDSPSSPSGNSNPPPIPSQLKRASFDYNGDGRSDELVYRRSKGGTFYLNYDVPTTQYATQFKWGGKSYAPLEGDFDGDKKSDLTIINTINGYLSWNILRSSTAQFISQLWGYAGDQPAIADYNGDGKDEIAVFRNGEWFILFEDGSVKTYSWGLPGDIAVPGDFTGDGTTDLAIWRPWTGDWWIKDEHLTEWFVQWGLPGDTPFSGDFSGDGVADFAVWRPSDGTWYVRNPVTDEKQATQWGLPGDAPHVGDFNGDGVLDFSVWRPSNGIWFHNFRNGTQTAKQWGLPGDTVISENR